MGSLLIGRPMMPWQRLVLGVALEVNEFGSLCYRRVVLTVPRQSGKTTLQLALFVHRALAWPVPQVMTYTAQTGKDARNKLIDDQLPMLKARSSPFRSLFRPRLQLGSEAILWANGSRHMLGAPTEKSGHGGTLDLAFIDEAFAQTDSRLEQAFSPAMATRPQAQLWVVSTAGTESSSYLRDKIDTGRASFADVDLGTAFFEWSAPDDADADDPVTWRGCMPALGHTIAEETVRAERASMPDDEFRRAYLNQWRTRGAGQVIPAVLWAGLIDRGSQVSDPVSLGVDVAPDRSWSSLAAAGGSRTDPRRWHVELIDHRPGTGWLVERTVEVALRAGVSRVAVDPASAAGSLISDMVRAGLDPVETSTRAMAGACGQLFDAVTEGRLVHLGQPEVAAALAGATKRTLADAWAWDRKHGTVITPLVAVTLALWLHREHAQGLTTPELLNSFG